MKRQATVALITISALFLTGISASSGGNNLELLVASSRSQPTLPGTSRTAVQSLDARRFVGAQLGIERLQGEEETRTKTTPQAAGEPLNMSPGIPFSAAVVTTVGGRNTHFDDVSVFGDFDGREDLTADHSGRVADFSNEDLPGHFTLTRAAVSAHTIANGFDENIFYYGDSLGNVCVAASTVLNQVTPTPEVFTINLPTVLNAFGTLNSDSQVVITGIAVSPVADLTSFPNVNGAYAPFANQIGEIIYVSFTDTGGGLRLSANNVLVRSGVLAFPVADLVSPAPTPPGVITPMGFPVQVGGAFGVVFSVFSNLAGVAVDDDGNAYFQQVDLTQFTGANIVKITRFGSNQDRSLATSGILTVTTLNPAGGLYGTTSGPAAQVNRFTNYSGTSTFFGNIAAIASGPGNALYAAVARSFVPSDDSITQNTQGLFQNPAAIGPTPAMVISFVDAVGAFDTCTSPAVGFAGTLPIGNGIADTIPGTSVNWRAFVHGTGPDVRTETAPNSLIFGTPDNTQKVDLQIDFTVYSGITIDEGGKLYVVSGGTPAGVGLNPSPRLGEVLCFEDLMPADRRADYTDLRGAANLPNPPQSGGNVGDGFDSRADHIFWQAPIDIVTATPTGIAGLARGFLRYLNRTAPNSITNLPNGTVQGDDATNGPIAFDDFDGSGMPGFPRQVAGGDDQNPPFRGDDADSGFEFNFGGLSSVHINFFLNSNGNITFGMGDTDNTPTVVEFRSGLAKIAPAWSDLNPASRSGGALNTFPVQALGFAGVNTFKIRWINVPEFGREACGSSNTLSISLSDDGIGIDESTDNALNPANPIGQDNIAFDLQEGPTDVRFVVEPSTGVVVGTRLRREGSGYIVFDYGRMDLLGTADRPVLTGYSVGGLNPTNPPGLCDSNLSEVAAATDAGGFTDHEQGANIESYRIGEGTEPTLYEFFNEGSDSNIDGDGGISLAVPNFDLRFEGNTREQAKPQNQTDPNSGTVQFFGLGFSRPSVPVFTIANPVRPVPPVLVAPDQPQVTTNTTIGIVNALGSVDLNVFGSGFFPNETTIICPGFGPGVTRPGKTVTTAIQLVADTNFDGVPDLPIPLGNVTPQSPELVTGALLTGTNNTSLTQPQSGTAFPYAVAGGTALVRVITTFTAGDNNIFGVFTREAAVAVNLGLRAPVVTGAVPTGPVDCSFTQTLLIGGHHFILPNGVLNVTSVFATELGNPENVIPATSASVLDANNITAHFDFGTANMGRTFLIFVSGPNGTSRNLRETDPRPAGVPTGNEEGVQVTVTCSGTTSAANVLQFAGDYYGMEGCASAEVTVERLNPEGTVSVDFQTNDGTATQKGDYTATFGTLTFGPGETSKTISVPINADAFVEGNERFTITLSNPTGGAFIAQSTATLTIVDTEATSSNTIDEAQAFVCQNYHDFLNRSPDPAGLAFWTSQITDCGTDADCIVARRTLVSAAFFLSIEFQETGFYVIRSQRAAFGSTSSSATRLPYFQFLRDAQQVGRGVVVGQAGFEAQLDQNKQAYATALVTSAEFLAQYSTALSAEQFVGALFASAAVTPTTAERNAAISAFGAGGTSGRAAALRSIADSESLRNAEFNAAFVLMQYHGYLRRAPDDDGYNFWLNKLNTFNGNFVEAEMVKAFILSGEYRERFGQP